MATLAEEMTKLGRRVFPQQAGVMPKMPGINGITPGSGSVDPVRGIPREPPKMSAAGISAPQVAVAAGTVDLNGGTPQASTTPPHPGPLPPPTPDPTPAPGPLPPANYNDSVVETFNEITASNNPLIRMARQNGIATANKRGLANTSMAAGAAEAEAYKAALPLAQQDAQTAANKNLAMINNSAEMKRLEAQLANSDGQQRADILAQMERLRVSGDQELTRLQTAATLDQSRIRLQGEIDTALQATGGEQQRQLATLQGTIQSALQSQADGATMQRLSAQFAQDLVMSDRDNAAQLERLTLSGDQEIRRILIAAQEERQNLAMQIAAGDRQAVAAGAISIFQAEASIRAALLGNTTIPASERSAYERAIASLGDPVRAFLNLLYTAPPAGGGTAAPAGGTGTTPPVGGTGGTPIGDGGAGGVGGGGAGAGGGLSGGTGGVGATGGGAVPDYLPGIEVPQGLAAQGGGLANPAAASLNQGYVDQLPPQTREQLLAQLRARQGRQA